MNRVSRQTGPGQERNWSRQREEHRGRARRGGGRHREGDKRSGKRASMAEIVGF